MKQQELQINQAKSDIRHVLLGMLARAKDGVVQMAPGVAKRILDDMNFEGQRSVKEHRVLKHLRRIDDGLWRESFPVTIAAIPSGEMMVIDGQHRLTAISRNSASVPVTIILAKAATEHEARRLYAGFDEPTGARSVHEVLSAVGLSTEIGLPRAFTTHLYNALPILRNGLEPATGSEIEPEKYVKLFGTDSRLAEISEWKSEAEKYLEVVKKTTGKVRAKLQSAGFMAVALYTFRYQPGKAHNFWHGLAENDGLKKDDPRAALLRDIFERVSNNGSSRQITQAPSLAWNAYCQGRPLKIIKCVTGAAITLWGTPIGGRSK